MQNGRASKTTFVRRASELGATRGTDVDFVPTGDDYASLCAQIDPRAQAPAFIGSWLAYLELERERSRRAHQQLLTVASYLQTDPVELLLAIDDCVFFRLLEQLAAYPPSDLGFLAGNLFSHYEATRELKKLIDDTMPGDAHSIRRV